MSINALRRLCGMAVAGHLPIERFVVQSLAAVVCMSKHHEPRMQNALL